MDIRTFVVTSSIAAIVGGMGMAGALGLYTHRVVPALTCIEPSKALPELTHTPNQ